jgi:hypothetical protein
VETVFLSYSKKDYFFAELASVRLSEKGIAVWRDQSQLRGGDDWRQGIEEAISDSRAVLIAMSSNSAESAYVTFEWSYALGRRKALIPLKLNECKVHPRLAIIQYIDFSNPGALPWETLVERIRQIETRLDPDLANKQAAVVVPKPTDSDSIVKEILDYLNQRGYQVCSYERLSIAIGKPITDDQFDKIIDDNPNLFRHATIVGGKRGIAKLNP